MSQLLLRKAARMTALAVALAALVWHVLPHAVWASRIRPELALHEHAARLHVPLRRTHPDSPAGWSDIVYSGLTLRVPLADPADRSCGTLPGYCYRALGPGHVSVHGDPMVQTWAEMLDVRAPDADDISFWRSASTNWRTILALRAKMNASWRPAEVWRFETLTARGVVTLVQFQDRHSHVLVAYPLRGGTGRTIGVAGRSQDDIWQIVGSIGFVEP